MLLPNAFGKTTVINFWDMNGFRQIIIKHQFKIDRNQDLFERLVLDCGRDTDGSELESTR